MSIKKTTNFIPKKNNPKAGLDNKDIILLSLLQYICQNQNNSQKLFKLLSNYLMDLGIIQNHYLFSSKYNDMREFYVTSIKKLVEYHNSKNRDKKDQVIKLDNELIALEENKEIIINIYNARYKMDFIEIEKLDDGGFGSVFKAHNKLDCCLYAIKKIPFIRFKEFNNIRLLKEVKFLAKFNHPNIIRYYSTWIELAEKERDLDNLEEKQQILIQELDQDLELYPTLFIQMELCKLNLREYIRNRNYNGDKLNIAETKYIFRGIVLGLEYIHSKNILHRDLNPNNIFLDENRNPKIGDFGLSIDLMEKKDLDSNYSSSYGLKQYLAPEYIQANEYTEKSDIYSLGIIFLELLNIFNTESERILILNDLKKSKFPEGLGKNFKEESKLIERMLDLNPLKRPSIAEIKAFQDI